MAFKLVHSFWLGYAQRPVLGVKLQCAHVFCSAGCFPGRVRHRYYIITGLFCCYSKPNTAIQAGAHFLMTFMGFRKLLNFISS